LNYSIAPSDQLDELHASVQKAENGFIVTVHHPQRLLPSSPDVNDPALKGGLAGCSRRSELTSGRI